ncbi:MAG: GNAT family N-acetyltransferase [Bacteroidota bacterium]
MSGSSPIIKQINHEITWPVCHRVMWPNHPFDFVKVPNDAEGTHFGLYIGDQLITVVSLFVTDEGVQFRKLATEDEYQGLGYGSIMLEYIIDWCKAKGYHRLWCNARKGKTQFYQKFGMAETDRTYMKGGIEFVVMEMNL